MSTEILEIRQLLREVILSQKDTEARFRDTEARFRETDKKFQETDKKFQETDKKVKEAFELFTSQWGRLMESLVEGDILHILNERGIKVQDTSTRRKGSYEGQNYEYDIIAHNGKETVVIEVKTTLKVKDVKNFIKKLKNTRKFLRMDVDDIIYGAIAFLQADAGSEIFAQNQDLFVIRATGDSAAIINPMDFIPATF
jgi:hypothetical protein